jgi:hypothetical protein
MHQYADYDEEDDEGLEEVYFRPPKRRASATAGHDVTFYERETKQQPTPSISPVRPRNKPHIFTYFGIGMVIMLLLYMAWVMVVVPWWTGVQVQWHYGDTRISLMRADVGHGGTSRFIAFDSGGDIVIVEVVARKYLVYTQYCSNKKNKLINNEGEKGGNLMHARGWDKSQIPVKRGGFPSCPDK